MKPFPEIPNTKLYLVGGCVRDHLLGKPVKDRDFVAVSKYRFKPFVKQIEKLGRVFHVKPEFLTIRCMIDNEPIDIAFPRSEAGYIDGRHPTKVKSIASLRQDAQRRDFTINAQYLDKNGAITDFYGGLSHLKQGIIQSVGSPQRRFKEDFLRVLRGIRFAIGLGFTIDWNTYQAMKINAKHLDKISTDRIKDELNKCLILNPYRTVKYIHDLKLEKILEEKELWFTLTSKQR